MEQLEIPLDLEQFALSGRPLMYAQDRDGTVRLAPANFKAPKWDLATYSYDTYTQERGYHRAVVRLDFVAQARKPWKPPASTKKPFEPTGYEVGATVTFPPMHVGGGNLTGQVWCTALRPHCVWVASGCAYYMIDTRSQHNTVVDMWVGKKA